MKTVWNLTSRAAHCCPRGCGEYTAIKFFRHFERFLFFERFAHAFDQAAATVADRKMFVEDCLLRALDQTVEVVGDERVERAATEHLASGRGVDDAPFDFSEPGDFAHLRFFPL